MTQSHKGPFLGATIAGLLVLWAVASFLTYRYVVIPNGNRFDFYPRWVGARAILSRGNPYTAEVTRQIQTGMFGHTLKPEEDQHRFAYMAPIAWLLFPFWLVPFPIAVSGWSGLAIVLLLVLPFVVFRVLDWRPTPLALACVLIFGVLIYRYPINAYLLGQFIPFLLACLVTAWWGLSRGKWGVTLVALVLALVRPEMLFLQIAVLLLLAWELGYRKLPGLYCVAIGLLWAGTTIWIGIWEEHFLLGLRAYQAYASPIWPPQLLNNLFLAIPLVCGMLAWLVWMYAQVRRCAIPERVGWVLASTTLTGLTILPQTGNYTLVMALLAVWVILWGYKRHYYYWIPVLIVLASPWFFFQNFTLWERLVIPLALTVLLTHSWYIHKQVKRNNPVIELVHV